MSKPVFVAVAHANARDTSIHTGPIYSGPELDECIRAVRSELSTDHFQNFISSVTVHQLESGRIHKPSELTEESGNVVFMAIQAEFAHGGWKLMDKEEILATVVD